MPDHSRTFDGLEELFILCRSAEFVLWSVWLAVTAGCKFSLFKAGLSGFVLIHVRWLCSDGFRKNRLGLEMPLW